MRSILRSCSGRSRGAAGRCRHITGRHVGRSRGLVVPRRRVGHGVIPGIALAVLWGFSPMIGALVAAAVMGGLVERGEQPFGRSRRHRHRAALRRHVVARHRDRVEGAFVHHRGDGTALRRCPGRLAMTSTASSSARRSSSSPPSCFTGRSRTHLQSVEVRSLACTPCAAHIGSMVLLAIASWRASKRSGRCWCSACSSGPRPRRRC